MKSYKIKYQSENFDEISDYRCKFKLKQSYFKEATEKPNLQHLKLDMLNQARILKIIVEIKFPILTSLDLGIFLSNLALNGIVSIQPISLIYMPCLEVLNLGFNFFCSINGLCRINCKSLRIISIQKNAIKQMEKLNQLFTSNLQVLNLQQVSMHQVQDESLDYLFKIQSRNIQNIKQLKDISFHMRLQKPSYLKSLMSLK